MIGTVLGGRYTILEEVGKGGMALVYKAQCNVLNRTVAVKMLRTDLEGGDEFVTRFNAEAQSAAGLTHPNIVSIYDVGEENGLYYIVMEYIEGITLKEYIKSKGKLSSEESAEIASQICAALSVAHEKNIIHRDIKPHNIMITNNGLIKVTDFGIARASNNATMQVGDSILGSVHYISPEQARGGYVDCRSDIYSLGIVLYEMLTGKLPFESESPIAIAMKHLEEIPVVPKTLCPDISDGLQEIVLKAISKETRKRYQSVSSMKSDLDVIINLLKNTSDISDDVDEDSNNSDENIENTINISIPVINETPKESTENEDDMEAGSDISIADLDDDDISGNDADVEEISDEDDYTEYADGDLEEIDEEYEDDDYEERGGLSFNMIFAAIIIALFVVGGASLAIGAFVFPDAPFYTMLKAMWGDNDVNVPTLVGKHIDEAEDIAHTYELKINVIESEYGPEAEGTIIQQSIASGNSVKKGTIVNLHTSKGPDPELFNNETFVGEPESVIEKYIKKGYNIVKKPKTDKTKTKGDILEVSLKGNQIIFYINSDSEDESTVKVPDLRGLTVNQARAELEDAGLLLYEQNEYETVETTEVSEGRVVSQSYPVGDSVKAKTEVKIILARKPEKNNDAKDNADADEPKDKDTNNKDKTNANDGNGNSGSDKTGDSKPSDNKTDNQPASKTVKKTITLDLSEFDSSTTVKIVDPSGKAVYDRTVDPSAQSEISITLEGSGTVNYVIYVNGSEYCKYPVIFGN